MMMNLFRHKHPAVFLLVAWTLFLLFSLDHPSHSMERKSYPEGFSLIHPSEWQAQVVDPAFIWISQKNNLNSPFIFVFSFFSKTFMQSRIWLMQHLGDFPKFMNQITLETLSQFRDIPDEARTKFRFQRRGITYRGMALCSMFRKSGILYVTASPRETFEAFRHQLIGMLESFRFEASSKRDSRTSHGTPVQFRAFEDPRERAFSIDVPAGWTARGGTFLRASVDLVFALQVGSPDQKILIQYNDVNIPIFALPNQTLDMAGFREGSWYSPGYALQMLVKRYLPGPHFITAYLQTYCQPVQSAGYRIKFQPDPQSVFSSGHISHPSCRRCGLPF